MTKQTKLKPRGVKRETPKQQFAGANLSGKLYLMSIQTAYAMPPEHQQALRDAIIALEAAK